MAGWTVPGYTGSRELGTGGTGRRVEAVHDASGVLVTIIYPSPKLWSDEAFRDRFRADAERLAGLDHPNVVRVRDLVESGSDAALITDAVEGTTLRTVLTASAPLSPEAALAVMRGSLLGLGAAQKAGVVHRDYQPSNVLITADGTVKLTGFGLAVRTEAMMPAPGTPTYIAPELWEGAPPRPTTDFYAVAATFHECLTGRVPFSADSVFELQTLHRAAPIPVDGVPPALAPLLAQGLAKAPAERPADAAGFLAELEVAAVAACGPEWEERGQRELAALASGLDDGPPTVLSAAPPAMPAAAEGVGAGMGRGTKAGIAAAAVVVLGAAVAAVALSPGKHAAAAARPPGQVVSPVSDTATSDDGGGPGIAAGGAPAPGTPHATSTSAAKTTGTTSATSSTTLTTTPLTPLTTNGLPLPTLNPTAPAPSFYPSQSLPSKTLSSTPPNSSGPSTPPSAAVTISATATMTTSDYSGPCPPTTPPSGTVKFTVSGLPSGGTIHITYSWQVVDSTSGASSGSGSAAVDAPNGTTSAPFTITDDPHSQKGISGTVQITWTADGTPGGSTTAGSITCTPSSSPTSSSPSGATTT